tara:strand:+ start:439 stop:894 length:456 start_codon:yes stop_codon:yes gene_type:complete
MNRKAFTLIELLVVVAIIGILAAVGVVTYNGYTGAAKTSSTKSNHQTVKKYILAEVTKCELGESKVMNDELTCSGRTASDVISAAISELSNFKNSYSATNNAVRNASSKDDVDVGFVNLNLDRTFIEMNTCFQTPCSNSKNKLSIVLTVVD